MVRLKIKILETPRLLLRSFELQDLHSYQQILGDPRVAQWLGRPEGFTMAETQQWIQGFGAWADRHGFAPWAIIEKSTTELIGHCGLKFAEVFADVELLYALRADKWSQGIATEAARVALDDGFGELQLPKVLAFTMVQNSASRVVLEKLGFSREREFELDGFRQVLYGLEASTL
jgi:ribosomal-protein-alanine N-acetyltransferase